MHNYELANMFVEDPREYALTLVDEGEVDAYLLLRSALQYLSKAEVRNMLEWNKATPHFIFGENNG